VTGPERVAPKGAARGRGASSKLVEVYKILFKAGEPLTVPQIAEQMPRTGYLSAAMTGYREHKERTDPTWLEGKGATWSRSAQNEAMTWWVRKIVASGIRDKIFNTNSRSATGRGQDNLGRITQEGTYSPGKPPKTYRPPTPGECKCRPMLVDWSPELEEELTGGHSAGMQFLSQLDESRRGKLTMAQAKALLDLAERAIRKRQ
jgi:hypothetical protein